MIIVDSLKHNKHQQVNIPSGADLFARVGARAAKSSDFSGDTFIDPSLTKVEAAKQVFEDAAEPQNAD